jgi:hypothetical protein
MKPSDMGNCPAPSGIRNGISGDSGYRPVPDIPLHRGLLSTTKRNQVRISSAPKAPRRRDGNGAGLYASRVRCGS